LSVNRSILLRGVQSHPTCRSALSLLAAAAEKQRLIAAVSSWCPCLVSAFSTGLDLHGNDVDG
jgi:hypothetical protein